MRVQIDEHSGFCPGVTNAIELVEKYLKENDSLYCLGDIVHNTVEVTRLKKMGLKIIDFDTFKNLKNTIVLIRAHGEPPSTYKIAKQNNIKLIDATCIVVINLQNQIRKVAETGNSQIVIYGKKMHAEVNGLVGQTNNNAVVISDMEDIGNIDYSKSLHVFSQTTRSPEKYKLVVNEISKSSVTHNNGKDCTHTTQSICPFVEKREPLLIEFSKKHDIVLFVSDKKSSNGKMLFNLCSAHNNRCYFISSYKDVKPNWFNTNDSVGICGATSTPRWLMEEVAQKLV